MTLEGQSVRQTLWQSALRDCHSSDFFHALSSNKPDPKVSLFPVLNKRPSPQWLIIAGAAVLSSLLSLLQSCIYIAASSCGCCFSSVLELFAVSKTHIIVLSIPTAKSLYYCFCWLILLQCYSVIYHLVHVYIGIDYNVSQMISKPYSPGTGRSLSYYKLRHIVN